MPSKKPHHRHNNDLDPLLDAAYIDSLLAFLEALDIESASRVSAMKRVLFSGAMFPSLTYLYDLYGEDDDSQ